MPKPPKILDQKTGKKLSLAQMQKLSPWMKTQEDAEVFARMNRKERRKFYAKNKKMLGK